MTEATGKTGDLFVKLCVCGSFCCTLMCKFQLVLLWKKQAIVNRRAYEIPIWFIAK